MKVVLVTSFEDYFVEQDTLPELARRGVEVFARFEAKECGRYDFRAFKAENVDLILHMNEVGSHSASQKLSQLAREAGIPIRALSRKKASWTFLPSPLDNGPESLPKPETDERLLRPRSRSHGFTAAATLVDLGATDEAAPVALPDGGLLHPGLSSVDGEPVPDRVRTYITTTRFDRKDARLRDVIRLVVAHGITEYDRVFAAVEAGRQTGVFPRLIRQKGEDLPKLVRSMLAHELSEAATKDESRHVIIDRDDKDALEGIGLVRPEGVVQIGSQAAFEKVKEHALRAAAEASARGEDPLRAGMLASREKALEYGVDLADGDAEIAALVKEEEATMKSGKVVPMHKDQVTDITDEVSTLRARVAELEKLAKAHEALTNLVKLGYMTPLEAAAKLFPSEAP